jgi:indoleacetamide hydrolase
VTHERSATWSVEGREDVWNAFIAIEPDPIREATSDVAVPGLTFAVKDNINVRGIPTTCGADLLRENVAQRDAPVVTSLRNAGHRFVGKTNMHELARGRTTVSVVGGQTTNPRDTTRCASGSSGGSAAAVAAGLVDLALGTDTGQSVRSPAGATGVFGLRPTWGTVEVDGVVPVSPSRDVVGLMAREPEVLRAGFLAVWSAPVGPVAAAGFSGDRIGLFAEVVEASETVVRTGTLEFVNALTDSGVEVVTIPESDLLAFNERLMIIFKYEHSFAFDAHFKGSNGLTLYELLGSGTLHPTIREPIEESLELAASRAARRDYLAALQSARAFSERLSALLLSHGVRAVLHPTSPHIVARIGDHQQENAGFIAAVSGRPALTIPRRTEGLGGSSTAGAAFGIDLLGSRYDDLFLLDCLIRWRSKGIVEPSRSLWPATSGD